MIGDQSFPWAPSHEVFDAALEATTKECGSEDLTWAWAPSAGDDPRARQFVARFARLARSPAEYGEQMWVNAAIDVRSILPKFAVPTLVCHRGGDTAINVGQGRYAAGQIPDRKEALPHAGKRGDRDRSSKGDATPSWEPVAVPQGRRGGG
jgi:pimeloyl-ACP methyl ester carboxylesterase